MSEHRLTEADMRMALRQRGHTEAQISQLLGDIKADAWDEGAETAWKATGDGHNGEYAHPFGTHDGTAPFQLANPNTPNPYREQEEV